MAEVYGSVFEIKVAFRKLHSCDKETHWNLSWVYIQYGQLYMKTLLSPGCYLMVFSHSFIVDHLL